MEWRKSDVDSGDVRSLSTRYEIDLLSASILARRGITEPQDILFFLETDQRYMHNPFHFLEMEEVVDRILRARSEGERVKVFGDRDADGITSTVLIHEALRKLGIETEWAVPQGDDPYGLTMEAVDEFFSRDGSLFITVDCGISNHREIAHAAELGIDTIVIDHHNPQEELPPAAAIINPKIEDSGYPFRDLAGCGVTAKVVWALSFAETPLYNQTICLLNVRPGNETLILEAVLLTNLVEVDRLSENIVPGMVEIDQTRLAHFLSGRELFVYDAPLQLKLLKRIFGPDAEIGLVDIAPELWRVFPSLRNKSLVRLLASSKSQRYAPEVFTELEVLIRMFETYVLKSHESLSEGFSELLDLVALGTLADLMPLVDENRILVRLGLERMSRDPRPALRTLIARQGLDGKRIVTTDIGWQISPLINATGRLGVPEKAVELFLTDDEAIRSTLVDEVIDLNKQRKRLGESAWDLVINAARESYQDLDGRIVQVGSSKIHRGITGIIATRLVKFFHVPALVVSLLEDKAVGSARSVDGINIREFLDGFEDIFLDYGGHDYAAGYSMRVEDYERFRNRLSELAPTVSRPEEGDGVIEIDAELPQKYFTPELADIVERLEPYGEGYPPLVFVSRRVVIEELQIIGKRDPVHLRLLIKSGNHRWPAVFWNAAPRVNVDFGLGDTVDIAFRLGRNYYRHQENLQLTILDIKR